MCLTYIHMYSLALLTAAFWVCPDSHREARLLELRAVSYTSGLLKLECAHGSPGDLVKMEVLIQKVPCGAWAPAFLPHSLSNGAGAAGPAQHWVIDCCIPSEMWQPSVLSDRHWFSCLQGAKGIIRVIVWLCYGECSVAGESPGLWATQNKKLTFIKYLLSVGHCDSTSYA